MGLKKTNYIVNKLGITLPEAYAYVKELSINGDSGTALIVVQTTRERCKTLAPIEAHYIPFKVDREENPYKTVYETSKARVTEKTFDYDTGTVREVTSSMPFADWEDDIVTE